MVKDLVIDVDKRELLAERAESLLLCLKQRLPGLPQTTLDTSKIQYNKVYFLGPFLSFYMPFKTFSQGLTLAATYTLVL